jgi:hypothetical protein
MTGRFHRSWGDFGGIRTEPSLEYDCLYGVANALGTTIGDHFHPRGDINYPVMEMDARIYARLRKIEPWCKDAVPLTDLAVVMSKPYWGAHCVNPKPIKSIFGNGMPSVLPAACSVNSSSSSTS